MILPLGLVFAIILGGGWTFSRLFHRIRLPAVLGMVIFGILCSLFLKHQTPGLLWEIAPSLKSLALMIILLRAGLGLNRRTLRKTGLTALLMAFLPCLFEGSALAVLFHFVFGFGWYTAGLTGFMLAAVSPAVIVPSMLDLRKKGHDEAPTIILAGASADDVLAITLFSVFLGLSTGGRTSLLGTALSIPLSLVAGILLGGIAGGILSFLFKVKTKELRATEKTLILLVLAALLVQAGEIFHFAALLGLMTVGFVLLERNEPAAHEISSKLSKLWIFAEITLFVLIGFSLDPATGLEAGGKGLLVIAAGLVIRSLGVLAATAFSGLNGKERIFCMVAYLPKATVQAALGGVALSYGLPEGKTILAIAVLAILFTAPLGLFGIRILAPRLLKNPDFSA